MAKNKIDLKVLSNTDLEHKIEEEQMLLAKLKFNHTITQLENPMSIRNSRRNVAKMLTELNQRTNHND